MIALIIISLNFVAVFSLQFTVGFSLLLAVSRSNRVSSVATIVNLGNPPKDELKAQPNDDISSSSSGKIPFKVAMDRKYVSEQSEAFSSGANLSTVNEHRHRGYPQLSDNIRWDKDHFSIAKQYYSYVDYVLLPSGIIDDRLQKLAIDIVEDYEGRDIVFVCVLKGASIFFHNFLAAWKQATSSSRTHHTDYEFIRVHSYSGKQSSGEVKIHGMSSSSDDDSDNSHRWMGKHLILVEDMIDTGLTLTKLTALLKSQGAASISVLSLLIKRVTNSKHIQQQAALSQNLDGLYVGFGVPDVFVVGYGLDYNERLRDLPHLSVLNQAGIDKFR